MYEKWPWTIEKTYIASLCKQHLIAFDEESDQFCKWVLLQEKCLARHRKLPGEAQHMWNAAVHGIGDVWLDCKCLTYENFFLEAHHESSILHYSPQIACLILVQDSWRDPDTPKQLGLRKVHGLHERSLHLDFLSKMFKTSGYKPLLPRDSHYAWSIFSYSTHLTQWVQTCTYDIVCRSLINISYHNIPHRMPSDRCTWAVWTQQRMILTEICFPFLQVIAKTAKKLRRD